MFLIDRFYKLTSLPQSLKLHHFHSVAELDNVIIKERPLLRPNDLIKKTD